MNLEDVKKIVLSKYPDAYEAFDGKGFLIRGTYGNTRWAPLSSIFSDRDRAWFEVAEALEEKLIAGLSDISGDSGQIRAIAAVADYVGLKNEEVNRFLAALDMCGYALTRVEPMSREQIESLGTRRVSDLET